MTTKIVLAGFGGQGILSMGQFLVLSALREGKEVSYLPAYGPEMRGGTANCSLVISNKPIASPLCSTPDILVAMNGPSLEKFEEKVKSGGIIIINSSLVSADVKLREDVRVIKVAANDLAIESGTVKAANMVMIGVMQALTNLISEEKIYECLDEKFPDKPKLVEVNRKAYFLGKSSTK